MKFPNQATCLKILFSSFSIMFLASCILSPTPFHEVRYHDLGNPDIINANGPYVDFSKFTTSGPYKTKMVFRSENNELQINEYNRWAQSPESLIGRYLQIAFRANPPNGNMKKYSVNGTVLVFEADKKKQQAVLIIEYTIVEPYQGKKKSFSRTFISDLKKTKPQFLAQGMADIATQLTIQLKEDMLSMK